MADATDLKSVDRKVVRVRLPPCPMALRPMSPDQVDMLNGKTSKYEKNIALQPELIRRILGAPVPAWMKRKPKRIFFVGVGTNFHAAQLLRWLWSRRVSADAIAVHSFDFVRSAQPVRPKDVVVLLSHRGGDKSFTVQAGKIAKKLKATTIGVSGQGAEWSAPLDHRIETCELEDTGPFTKSFTTTLASIAAWIGDKKLNAELLSACDRIELGPKFPTFAADGDLIFLGDGPREWIAREINLKVQETAYRRTRAFGLEEFLHGPQVSAGEGSFVVAFSSKDERWQAARDYLRTIEVPLLEVRSDRVGLSDDGGGWLWQIFWGQRLAAEICRWLSVNPDTLRTQDPRYQRAWEALKK